MASQGQASPTVSRSNRVKPSRTDQKTTQDKNSQQNSVMSGQGDLTGGQDTQLLSQIRTNYGLKDNKDLRHLQYLSKQKQETKEANEWTRDMPTWRNKGTMVAAEHLEQSAQQGNQHS